MANREENPEAAEVEKIAVADLVTNVVYDNAQSILLEDNREKRYEMLEALSLKMYEDIIALLGDLNENEALIDEKGEAVKDGGKVTFYGNERIFEPSLVKLLAKTAFEKYTEVHIKALVEAEVWSQINKLTQFPHAVDADGYVMSDSLKEQKIEALAKDVEKSLDTILENEGYRHWRERNELTRTRIIDDKGEHVTSLSKVHIGDEENGYRERLRDKFLIRYFIYDALAQWVNHPNASIKEIRESIAVKGSIAWQKEQEEKALEKYKKESKVLSNEEKRDAKWAAKTGE